MDVDKEDKQDEKNKEDQLNEQSPEQEIPKKFLQKQIIIIQNPNPQTVIPKIIIKIKIIIIIIVI